MPPPTCSRWTNQWQHVAIVKCTIEHNNAITIFRALCNCGNIIAAVTEHSCRRWCCVCAWMAWTLTPSIKRITHSFHASLTLNSTDNSTVAAGSHTMLLKWQWHDWHWRRAMCGGGWLRACVHRETAFCRPPVPVRYREHYSRRNLLTGYISFKLNSKRKKI